MGAMNWDTAVVVGAVAGLFVAVVARLDRTITRVRSIVRVVAASRRSRG